MKEIEVNTLTSIHHKEPPDKEIMQKYVFMIWDGMEFFGFAFDKLPRLRGHKESFADKFQNRKKIATLLLLLILGLWVVLEEFSQLGKVKSQEIKFDDKKMYNESSHVAVPLVSIIKLEAETILNILEKKSIIKANDTKLLEKLDSKLLEVEEWLCKNID